MRRQLTGGAAGGVGELAEGLGEEVADAEDDAVEGAAAGAVEDNAALVEEGMETAADDALEERELVGVVGVEGGAVDAGCIGDLLDGDFVELAGVEEGWRVPAGGAGGCGGCAGR